MLIRSARNVVYIIKRHEQGLTPGQIYQRVTERMVWDGPYPKINDIYKVIAEYAERGPRSVEPLSGADGGGSTIYGRRG